MTLLKLSCCLGISLALNSCGHQEVLDPFNGHVYMGDPSLPGLYRNASTPPVMCNDPKMSDFICFHKDDFQELIKKLMREKK